MYEYIYENIFDRLKGIYFAIDHTGKLWLEEAKTFCLSKLKYYIYQMPKGKLFLQLVLRNATQTFVNDSSF